VSTAVDYLTRVALGTPAVEAFRVSVSGAGRLSERARELAYTLCEVVDGSHGRVLALPGSDAARFSVVNENNPRWAADREVYFVPDAMAIRAAVVLASFDALVRAGAAAYNPDTNTEPDEITSAHIATMVARSLAFAWEYGPILVDGFTMLGGYTSTIDTGDGDFVTRDTLWDSKVSVRPPTSQHTLQLLIYWLLARRSEWNWHPTWNWNERLTEADWCEVWDLDEHLRRNRAWPDDLRGPAPTHIGVFNPRLDAVYRLDVASIDPEIIAIVEREVIGY
jgi:hypothetical protein